VAATIESSGDIEVVCQTDGLAVGITARLVFRSWDAVNPPFTVKVRGPSGKMILDRVIRDLPTGRPQSSPPVTFSVSGAGEYMITIAELYGKAEGAATLRVTE
jgi:hypothetical protein